MRAGGIWLGSAQLGLHESATHRSQKRVQKSDGMSSLRVIFASKPNVRMKMNENE